MANVADRIVEALEAANVRRIYGLVGDSLNGITESLRVRGKMEWIAVRHEEVAAFAAGAQAADSGVSAASPALERAVERSIVSAAPHLCDAQ